MAALDQVLADSRLFFALLHAAPTSVSGRRKAPEVESKNIQYYITLPGSNLGPQIMSELKRSITQLGDFWPTVAGDLSQSLSVTTLPDTQASKRTRVQKDLITPLNIQASKKSISVQPNLPPFKTKLYKKNKKSTLKFENKNVKQPIEASPSGPYEEYMTLDQVGPAIIGSENTEEPTLMIIKRAKKNNKSCFSEIAPFTSDHLVQIRAIYKDGSDAVIVYET